MVEIARDGGRWRRAPTDLAVTGAAVVIVAVLAAAAVGGALVFIAVIAAIAVLVVMLCRAGIAPEH